MGILDTNQGQYINVETGQSISLNEAIENGLVLVESGVVKREDRERKVSSLHIDEEEEEVVLIFIKLKCSNNQLFERAKYNTSQLTCAFHKFLFKLAVYTLHR